MSIDHKKLIAISIVTSLILLASIGVGYSVVERQASTTVEGNTVTIEKGTFSFKFGDASGQLQAGSQAAGLFDGKIENSECTAYMMVYKNLNRWDNHNVNLTVEWLKDPSDTSAHDDNLLTLEFSQGGESQKLKIGNDKVSNMITIQADTEYMTKITSISGTDAAIWDSKTVSLRFTANDGSSSSTFTVIDNKLTFNKAAPINSGNTHLDSSDPNMEVQFDEQSGTASLSNNTQGTLGGEGLRKGFSLSIAPESSNYEPFYIMIKPGGVVVTVQMTLVKLDGTPIEKIVKVGPKAFEGWNVYKADYWGETNLTLDPNNPSNIVVFNQANPVYIDIHDYTSIKFDITTKNTSLVGDKYKTQVQMVFETTPVAPTA